MTDHRATTITVARALADALRERGVRRIFGVPGGGSSLDLIEAAGQVGIEFVLTRTESAAAMMAAVTAELDGTVGVALSTKGPGLTNATNGLAYAALDRAPVVFVADAEGPVERAYVTHQVLDQHALLAPIAKASLAIDADTVGAIPALLATACTAPRGPVFAELSSTASRASVAVPRNHTTESAPEPDRAALGEARRLLAGARRPVIVAGLEARDRGVAGHVRALAAGLDAPVLTTYKAKGVVPDADPRVVGLFTGGAAEADCVGGADVIVLVGLDPVELIPQPWRYTAPVLDLALAARPVHYVKPAVAVHGPLGDPLAGLMDSGGGGGWARAELEALRGRMRARVAYPGLGMTPQAVVEIARDVAAAAASPRPRITVDAGAHMFSVTAFWDAEAPNDVLISNGLATMAFALPAGIAAALHEPTRPVLAFTGDGGLMMCLGELSTAAERAARCTVVVFNDAALSLIDIKQQQRALDRRAVSFGRVDFAAVAAGFGVRAWRAATPESYRQAVAEALAHDGPGLIDVAVDRSGYAAQLRAIRG